MSMLRKGLPNALAAIIAIAPVRTLADGPITLQSDGGVLRMPGHASDRWAPPQMPAFVGGDCTTAAGSVNLTCTKIDGLTIGSAQLLARLNALNKAGDTMTGLLTLSTPSVNGNMLYVSTNDFVSQYAYGGGYNNTAYITNDAPNGHSSPALTVAARSKNNRTGGEPSGLFAFGFNDGTGATLSPMHAIYGEARRYADAGITTAQEIDITEFGFPYATDAYSGAYAAGNMSAGLYVQSGGGCATSGNGSAVCFNPATGRTNATAHAASLAIGIGNNGAPFYTGIQFNYNAIAGNDGVTDGKYGRALIFPRNDAIEWGFCDNVQKYPTNCSNRLVGASIISTIKSAEFTSRMSFEQGAAGNGLMLRNGSGNVELLHSVDSSHVNGLQVEGSSAGVPVALRPIGSDTNINLSLVPKGNGSVVSSGPLRLQSYTVVALPACDAGDIDSLVVATDLTTRTYGAKPIGGGFLRSPLYCDGTSWAIH